MSVFDHNKELFHYGTPRHSGRYPWGSGKEPYQRNKELYDRIKELKSHGYSEKEVGEQLGITTRQLRNYVSIGSAAERQYNISMVKKLKEKGMSNVAIAERMGTTEGNVRNWLRANTQMRASAIDNTATALKEEMKNKKFLDVGAGVERSMGISRNNLDAALQQLQAEGYVLKKIQVPNTSDPTKKTTVMVLAPEGTEGRDIYAERGEIASVVSYTPDAGKTFNVTKYPASLDESRIYIRYREDGGIDKDGVIEIRPGVEDLSLGASTYAQVRIAVNNEKYMKGMAVYSNDIPDGYDVVYNTNKYRDQYEKVFKKLKDDPEMPFGALIKADGQYEYIDIHGEKKLSPINKLREEGEWDQFSKNLPSQFLSKQSKQLIEKQLKLTFAEKQDEYMDILGIENPTIRKTLLMEFAEGCDKDAVDLKACALPGQKTKVLIPNNDMSENEVYAPGFKNGETVCLVRYPHGDTSEIPTLTVNNKVKSAKEQLGNAIDAIAINSEVAGRLSGADFDGDYVTLIPVNDRVKIKTKKPLEGLKGFEPKDEYPEYPGMKIMNNTQNEMGRISNLITDMQLKGATNDEICRAVKHSMVVIDAEKHHLDYKQSEIDNDIAALKTKYQGGPRKGASTLISQAKGKAIVDERKRGYSPNEEGDWEYTNTGREYTVYKKMKDGSIKEIRTKATQESTKMYETKDARTLISKENTIQERLYADFANNMKQLARDSRKEAMKTGNIDISKEAKIKYANEIESLNSKLNIALSNAPKERQAQIRANEDLKNRIANDPSLKDDKEKYKKARTDAANKARAAVGAGKQRIDISDSEWEAINSGALSSAKVSSILANSDLDAIKKRATPRLINEVSVTKQNRIKSMSNSGYTISEIAENLGVSPSTVTKYIK